MKVLQAYKSGWFRSLHSWTGILVQWIISLTMAAFIAVPLKGTLKSGFGSSMITERFLDGLNVEAFSDLGPVFSGLLASLGTGIMFLLFINFLTNAFITGGLFESVRLSENKDKSGFWNACANNFISFFFIQLLTGILILLTGLLIVGIPSLVVSTMSGISEKTVFQVILAAVIVFALLLPIFLLIADYARAWQASNQARAFFGAIGYGFRKTFGTFRSSWLLMVLVILTQLLFLFVCLLVLPGMIPSTGREIFSLFLLSQLMFIIRIYLRVVRYGSVTSLMELNAVEDSSQKMMSGDFSGPY